MSSSQIPATIPEAGSIVDAAINASQAYYDVESQFPWSQLDLSESSVESRSLAVATSAAFQYGVRHGRRERNKSVFIPVFELEDGTEIPPSPKNAPAGWAQTWMSLLGAVTHPAGRARFADLLFDRGNSTAMRTYAEESVRAYVELASTDWHALDCSHGLLRAREIVRLTKMSDLGTTVDERIFDFAVEALERGDGPGVTLPLVGILAQDDAGAERIRQLIEIGKVSYSHDPDSLDYLLVIEKSIAPEQEHPDIDRARVDIWLKNASERADAGRLFDFQRAVRVAESSGISEEIDRAKAALQSLNREELGLQQVRHDFELPREVVDEYLGQFTDSEDWREALTKASLHEPLTGSIQENDEAAETFTREAPLTSSIRRIKLGGDGLPRWQAETDEEIEDERLTEQELLKLQLSGPLFAEGLRKIGQHYIFTPGDLVRFFELRPNVTERTPVTLSESYRQYWLGNYRFCGYLAVFQIEDLARNLILSTNKGLYEMQRKGRQGQYPALGRLLKELARLGLDRSWYRYLWTVFASPAGLNLRNEMAHGFVSEISEVEAAAALHAVSYLSLMRAAQE